MKTTLTCSYFKNYLVNEITIAKKGILLLENVLNDSTFHRMILGAKFSNTPDSPIEILDKLLSGSDSLDPRKDYTINFNLVMYSRWWSKVVGYILDGDRTIYTNRKYFPKNDFNAVDFASNLLHEYSHIMGYSHRSASDFQSVPYKLNTLFEAWVSKTRNVR